MTCKDRPTESEPALLDCDACGGGDDKCPVCGGHGHVRITQCPREMVSRVVWDMVEHVDVMKELRLLPVAGGTLDQTQSFEDCRRVVMSEKARVNRGRKNA